MMTTTIEKDELATELQELYLKSKQWISDLDFQEDDLVFVKRLFGINCPILITHNEYDKVTNMLIEAAQIEESQLRIRRVISEFMTEVALLINKFDPVIDISLIKRYNQIEIDIVKNLNNYLALKEHVFCCASEPVQNTL